MVRWLIRAGVLMCSVLHVGSSAAAPIYFGFEAQVTASSTGFMSIGDTFTGSFGYDSSSILIGPTGSNFYTAAQDIGTFGVNLSIGPTNPSWDYLRVGVTPGFRGSPSGAHGFNVSSFDQTSDPAWPSGPRINFQLTLFDSSATALSGIGLPSNLDLANYDTARIVIENVPLGTGVSRWRFDSQITRLERRNSPGPAIPEPTASTLFAAGGLLIGATCRRQTTRRIR